MAQAVTGVRDLVNEAISQNNNALVDTAYKNAKSEPLTIEKCNALIKGFCHFKEMEKAEAVLKDMKTAQITPNLATCKTMVEGHTTFAKALKCFKVMQLGGLNPHVEIYNALIESAFCHDSRDQIPVLLQDMEKNNIAPNAATYAELLKGYSVVGCKKQFEETLVQMQKESVTLGWQQYSEILDKLMALCEYSRIKAVVGLMQQSKISIRAIAKFGGSYEEAMKIVEELEAVEVINIGVRLILEHKKYDNVKKYLETLPQLHFSTYKLVIVTCAEQGQIGLAGELFSRMCTEEVKPDLAICNALLKGAGVDGEKIRTILQVMQQNLVAPDKNTKVLLEVAKLGYLLKGLSI